MTLTVVSRGVRLGACLALALCAGLSIAARSPDHWIGAWGFPSTSAPVSGAGNTSIQAQPEVRDVTIRQLVRIAADAQRIRVRFSNEFGDKPLRIGVAHLALSTSDGAIAADSDHAITFAGQAGVTIPANAVIVSDAIAWTLPALSQLSVSTYLPEESRPPAHRTSEYVAPGNVASAISMPAAQLVRGGALVTRIEVESDKASHVVVALGDSITEGVGSTVNTFRSWPDRLAERLMNNRSTRDWSVVNAGIGSNRLLHNDPGQGALARFDRDVLSVPGVSTVVLLEGINDIGYGNTRPAEAVSAQEITFAYEQIVSRAHAHGISVIAGTIPPFEGSHYYDQRGEQIRQDVNTWIRSTHMFDAVVDFDATLRDPQHPTQVRGELHRGDHLHPNDAGYQAMADAIDLKVFARQARK
ncbi:MAG: SGNH/GDSL hydrolase family protein [Povalibacter sp.]